MTDSILLPALGLGVAVSIVGLSLVVVVGYQIGVWLRQLHP